MSEWATQQLAREVEIRRGLEKRIDELEARIAELERFVAAYDEYASVMFTDKLDFVKMTSCGLRLRLARKVLQAHHLRSQTNE
jgi:hypothetical protein